MLNIHATIYSQLGYDWLAQLCQIPDSDREELKRNLRAIRYEKFLLTRYWNEVRTAVLEINHYRCRECPSTASQVHHPHYDFHGEEHLHLNELVPLCGVCHAATHGIYLPYGRRAKHISEIIPAVMAEINREIAMGVAA